MFTVILCEIEEARRRGHRGGSDGEGRSYALCVLAEGLIACDGQGAPGIAGVLPQTPPNTAMLIPQLGKS